MIRLSIPEIIHGSYKEGFEILWEIESHDYDRLKVTIEWASIPKFWQDAVEVYIKEEMKSQHPEVDVEFI